MPANYVLLGEVTLTQTTSFITISNIPQSGYTDLKLVASVRALRTGFPADDLVIQFNGVTSGYSGKRLYGLASSVSSDTQADIRGFASDADQTANVFGSNEFYIPNYLSSNYKSVSVDMVTENNGTDAPLGIFAGLWSNTAAINSIKVFCNNSNMVANSTFYLYGIAAVGTTPVIAPFATGGDIIQNDGTYWIHTFLSSGTFTPAKTLTCDYLVIGGGGGGGYRRGGGGGAGGFRSFTSQTLTALNNYSLTVGAGGAGSTNTSRGSSGVDSIFINTASGGGGGGSEGVSTGGSGASGGGGSIDGTYNADVPGTGNSPSTSPAQGTNGGAGNNDPDYGGGGGGGGATVAGGTGNSTTGGSGGNGTANSITGSSVTYAGGGGGGVRPNGSAGTGGTGGTGGGGNGGNSSATNATNGTANLGGGGGGGGFGTTAASGNGGSGVVIIRYAMV